MMIGKQKRWPAVGATLLFFLLLRAVGTGAQDSSSSRSKSKQPANSAQSVSESTRGTARTDNETSAGDLQDYRIGEQDVLVITVWKEPDLSGTVVVRPDGKITVPLVDEIKVVGMTPKELQRTLTVKFRAYLTVAQVTVTVREIHSRKVYLIGQVAREGSYQINSSTTVLQLIADAGGLRDFANRKKIYVLRHEQGRDVRYPFNYDQVVQGKTPSQNIVLRPGDTIVVP